MLMPSRSRHTALLVALSFAGLIAIQAQQPSARNVFWSASDLVQVAANPGAKPNTDRAELTPPKRIPSSTAHPRPHVEPELVAKNGYGQQPQLVRVSQEQIGLRYALLLRGSDGHYNEVSPTATFHSGDHMHLSIMANQPGYLYVIEQGSSGSWSSIYPRKGSSGEEPNNRIEPGQVYEIPSAKSFFRFDQNPGQEKLFLVLSRERIADLEGAINSLKEGGHPTSAPAQPDAGASQGEALEAANHIPDAFIQQLSSRDITLEDEETVDQPQSGAQTSAQTGAPSGEKAVYVVSKASYSKGESPRVVASVTLHHE
jgi:hypothetical protein